MLGAWGCGVFGNEPLDVAQWMRDCLHGDYQGVFKRVVFACYDKADGPNITAFETCFGPSEHFWTQMSHEAACISDLERVASDHGKIEAGSGEECLSRSLSHYLGEGACERYPEGELILASVPDWQSRAAGDDVQSEPDDEFSCPGNLTLTLIEP